MQTEQRLNEKYLYDLMHAGFQCTLEWDPILQSLNSHFGLSTFHRRFVHLHKGAWFVQCFVYRDLDHYCVFANH